MAEFEKMVYLGVNGEGSGKVNGKIGKGEGSGKAIVWHGSPLNFEFRLSSVCWLFFISCFIVRISDCAIL